MRRPERELGCTIELGPELGPEPGPERVGRSFGPGRGPGPERAERRFEPGLGPGPERGPVERRFELEPEPERVESRFGRERCRSVVERSCHNPRNTRAASSFGCS